jgi:iron(III) transport system permease protein
MLGGTLWIAAGVALVSVVIGLPLGILRGMFCCRCRGCGICCF